MNKKIKYVFVAVFIIAAGLSFILLNMKAKGNTAVIYKDGKILIAKRNLQKDQGGKWEFPGGKVEKGETNEEALKREIKEELDADIEVKEYVGENEFHYPEKDVKLIFYKAELISAKVKLLEHEDYKWIKIEEFSKYDFAEADKKVFEWLK